MKSRYLLVSLAFFAITLVSAQDSCLPQYDLPVKKVSLDNVTTIAYVEKGKGKPLIFIHGLGGNISHWLKNIESLCANYRCIAIDLPGYGHSTYTGEIQTDPLQSYANTVIAFSEKLKLSKVTLVGHSMGGQIAMIAALESPDKIDQLILVNPAGLETFTASEGGMMKNFATAAFFKNQDEAAVRTSFKNNFYSQPADVEELIAYRLRLKNCASGDGFFETVVKGIHGMLEHPVKESLQNIKQKVLVVFGADDQLIPNKIFHPAMTGNDIVKIAHENISNVTIVKIPEAGHMLPFEKPEQFNNAIKNFLK